MDQTIFSVKKKENNINVQKLTKKLTTGLFFCFFVKLYTLNKKLREKINALNFLINIY